MAEELSLPNWMQPGMTAVPGNAQAEPQWPASTQNEGWMPGAAWTSNTSFPEEGTAVPAGGLPGAEPGAPAPAGGMGTPVSLGANGQAALGLNPLPQMGYSPSLLQGKPEQEGFPMPDFGKLEARLASDQAAALKAIKAEADAKTAQIDYQTRQEAGQRQVENEAADRAIALKAAYDRELAKEPLPKYIPEKDNVNQVGVMMSAIAIIGSMLGRGGGQQAAMGAMQAMTGMMQGYMAGRKEVYEKNEREFEKKFQEVKARHEELTKRFNEGLAMLPYDMTKAKNTMLAALSAEGSEVAKKMVQAGQYKQAAELMASGTKGILEIEKLKQQMADRHEQRQLQKEIALARLEAAREKAAAGGGKGGSNYVENFNQQVVQNLGTIAKEVGNLKNIKFTTTGWMQGRNTSDFYNAPLGVLANKLTPADMQHLITNMGNLGYAIAKVESNGRQVTNTQIKKWNDQFDFREGDDPGVILHKMGQLRQIVDVAAEVKLAHYKQTGQEEMAKQLLQYKGAVDQAIPFSVEDVLAVFDFRMDKSGKTPLAARMKKDVRPDDTFGSYIQRVMSKGGELPKSNVDLGALDVQRALQAHGIDYDPDNFEYRIGPDGSVQSRKKAQ